MGIKSLNAPTKASIWFAVSNIVRKVILYASMPIFTRLLSVEQYGIYTLYCSWSEIIFLFTTLNIFSNVYSKFYIKYKDKIWEFTSSILFLTVFTSLIIGAILLGGYPCFKHLIDLPKIVIVYIIVDSVFTPAFNYWAVTRRYNYRYKGIVVLSFLQTVLNPVIGVAVILCFGRNGIWRCASVVMANCIINIPIFIWIFLQGKCYFRWNYWKEVLRSTLPLIPHYLSQILLNQMDRIMIGNICGIGYAAIYGIAYSISIASLIVNRAINDSYTPWLYTKLKKGDYKDIKKITNILCMLIAAMNFFVILIGPEIISILGTKEYKSAIWVIPPVAISGYLLFVYALFCSVEFYYEVQKYMAIVSIVAAFFNYILNYIFISKFGFIAAGYTTLFCYLLFVILHYFVIKMTLRKNRVDFLYDEKFIIGITCMMLVFGVAANILYINNWVRYSLIGMIICITIFSHNKVITYLKFMRENK